LLATLIVNVADTEVLVTSVGLTKREGAVGKQINYMLHMTIFMQLVAPVEEWPKFFLSGFANTTAYEFDFLLNIMVLSGI
jgi:hypothetical protein